ncbi:MAG: DNA/RNA non-specific endonuclease [Bryobacteraceae bacterium]
MRTTGRNNIPPEPLCGFVCDDTPFSKGHIMAFELGGPDISANIVPQYGQWNRAGDWRAMEMSVSSRFAGQFYVAILSYNFASKDYAGQAARFQAGEVFDWNHEQIPTKFDIFVLDARAAGSPEVTDLTNLLAAPAADEIAFARLFDRIRRMNPEAPPVLLGESYYQYEMPDIDREYWLGQHVFQIVDSWYTQYKARNTAQPAPPVPVTAGVRTRRGAAAAQPQAPANVILDDVTFTYAGADAVKRELMARKRQNGAALWDPGFLHQTVTPEFCVRARFASLPAKKWKQLRQQQVAFPQ